MLLVALCAAAGASQPGATGTLLPEGLKERRAALLQQCVSRWATTPPATALFEGSCGTNHTWTAGGEAAYCPDVQSDGNACDDYQCSPFSQPLPVPNDKPQNRHRQWLRNITTKEQTSQRHAELTKWLGARQISGGPVIMMAANAGYMYLFVNWVRHAALQGLNLSEPTMILTDDDSAKTVRSLGFRPLSTRMYRADILFASAEEETTASPIFGAAASHAGTNAMALVALTDLLQLGIDVLWTDADVVFNAPPLPWLSAKQPYVKCSDFSFDEHDEDLRTRVTKHWPQVLCFNRTEAAELDARAMHGQRGLEPDIQMMDDSRWDSAGPGSTGKVPPLGRAPARPLRLLRARGGPVQPGTPRARPSHWVPSHHLGGSSEPPPKSPI